MKGCIWAAKNMPVRYSAGDINSWMEEWVRAGDTDLEVCGMQKAHRVLGIRIPRDKTESQGTTKRGCQADQEELAKETEKN